MSFQLLSYVRGLKQNPFFVLVLPRKAASGRKQKKVIVQGALKMSYILLFPFALASLPAIPAFSHYALYPHCIDHPPGQPTNCSPDEWIEHSRPNDPSKLTFKIKSDSPRTVYLKFYSQQDNLVWPSSDRSYVINDYQLHYYRLRCNQPFEKICYGAWEKGNTSAYWGVGRDGTKGCRDCCYTCGTGDAGPINLTR